MAGKRENRQRIVGTEVRVKRGNREIAEIERERRHTGERRERKRRKRMREREDKKLRSV